MSGPRSNRPSRADTDVVGARIGAQIIDLILMFVWLFAVAAIIGPSQGGIYLAGLTLPLYGGLFEGYVGGQTPGKMALDIEVVDERGGELSPMQAFVRNVPAALVGGWLVYLVALASMAMTDTRQRVFDQVAGTVVVAEERSY